MKGGWSRLQHDRPIRNRRKYRSVLSALANPPPSNLGFGHRPSASAIGFGHGLRPPASATGFGHRLRPPASATGIGHRLRPPASASGHDDSPKYSAPPAGHNSSSASSALSLVTLGVVPCDSATALSHLSVAAGLKRRPPLSILQSTRSERCRWSCCQK